MTTDYTVSVRLLGPDGETIAHSTGKPGGGDLATSSLAAGQTIRDTHYLTLPDQLPASLSLVVYAGEIDAAGNLQVIAPVLGETLETWTER